MRLLIAVLIIVLLVGSSCSRVPDDDQSQSSGGPSDANSNGSSFVQPPRPSAPNDLFVAIETSTHWQNTGDPSTMDFLGLDMDINSGDLRGLKPRLDPGDRYVVFESRLSGEVRRLGIPIPQERRWRVLGRVPDGGVQIMNPYASLLPAVDMVLMQLDKVRAGDEERRETLETLMIYLRTEKAFEAVNRVRSLRVGTENRHQEAGAN